MNALFDFLASSAGRLTRAAAGIILILFGLLVVESTAGLIIALIGIVPLAAGLFDVCVFAPLAGLPFSGEALRRAVRR